MVQLIRPKERANAQEVGVSVSSAMAPGRAAAAGGQVIEQLSQEYFNQTLAVDQTIQYSRALGQATSEYGEASMKRMQQQVDDQGNPNYGTMLDDVKNMAPDIRARASLSISDPKVRAQFEANFDDFRVVQLQAAFKEQRRQQMDVGKTELARHLEQLASTAASGPDGLAYAENKSNSLIQTSAASGLLSHEEAYNMEREFSVKAREQSYLAMIDADPSSALIILAGKSPGELGLPPEMQRKLSHIATAKIEDNMHAQEIAQKEEEKKYKDGQGRNATELGLGVEDLAAGRADLDKAVIEKRISPEQHLALVKALDTRLTKAKTKISAQDRISSLIVSGKSLRNQDANEIDAHYETRVNEQEKATGKPLTLIEKAALATTYKRDVRLFSQELDDSFKSGDLKRVEEAAAVYKAVMKEGGKTIQGNHFTNEAEQIAIKYNRLVGSAGMEPAKALQQIREDSKALADPLRKEYQANLSKQLKGFSKGPALSEAINDSMGSEGWFGLNKAISPEFSKQWTELYKDSFLRNGNSVDAAKYAGNSLKRRGGVTGINGIEEVVLDPPERAFNTNTASLRDSLVSDVKSAHPEVNQLGIKAIADEFTNVNSSQPTYLVVGSDGLPIVNKATGQNERWTYERPSPVPLKALKLNVNQERVASRSMNHLTSLGVPTNHVAGIMANILHESAFEPGVPGDFNKQGRATSGGLFQHRNERLQALIAKLGPNWKADVIGQINFALSEPAGKKYLSTKFNNAEEASAWWTIHFENPKDGQYKAQQRAQDAHIFIPGGNAEAQDALKSDNAKAMKKAKQLDNQITNGTFGNLPGFENL